MVIALIALAILIVLGVDLAAALGLTGMAFLVFSPSVSLPLSAIPQKMVNGVDSFEFLAVPLFVLAGELMSRAGITERLTRFAGTIVGHITGGLAHVTIVVNMIMAGVSGSAVADAAAIGSVMIPFMRKRGYSAGLASAINASAATIGPIIPPSIPMVILGSITNLSVGRLFLAGALPGLLMGFALMIICYFIARKEGIPLEPKHTKRKLVKSSVEAFPCMMCPIIIVVGIASGVFTPTEASMIAVVYSLFLGLLFYRSLSIGQVWEALIITSAVTGAIMITVATANVVSWAASMGKIAHSIVVSIQALTSSPIVYLMLANLLLLVLGCFLEPIPILIMLAPLLMPIAIEFGIDPIHFGLVMVLNLMIGLLTPPVGLNVFITSSIAQTTFNETIRRGASLFLTLVAVLVIVTYVPAVSTWLPNLVMPVR
jgi:C4-dicarboxylate transporter, DctM subunit